MKEFKRRTEERMIQVLDDWYPCYEGGFVKLRISQNFYKEYYCALSVWGTDDFGMQMEFSSAYPEYVDAMYERWYEYIFKRVPNGITKEWFLEHGFYPAY